jgi:ABC-type nitrate/sulfonate/bicarbonate transport system permease component
MARGFMGSRWQIFCKIRLPNTLPHGRHAGIGVPFLEFLGGARA